MARLLFGVVALLVAFTPASAQWTPPHLVLFAPFGDAIDDSAAGRLQRFALDVGDKHLVIRGFADPSEGNETEVVDLSRRRAMAVHEHLQAYGVSAAHMVALAGGSPLPSGDDARQNRRVEIISVPAAG